MMWKSVFVSYGGVSKRGYCCRLVRRGESCSPEKSLFCVFGQANPAATADDGIGRFCFGTLTNGVTLLISPPMQSPAVSSPGWHVPL